jgi:phosphohistidine phosphatase
MIIHIIRHAQAIERAAQIDDEHRYLTCRGRKRFRDVAVALKELAIRPEVIFTSPKIRAVQTADILAEKLGFSGEVLVAAALGEDFTSAALRDLLVAQSPVKELVLVGHEPDFGMLVRDLLQLSGTCNLSKGCTVTMEVTLSGAAIAADLLTLVTGSGTVIRSPVKAVKWLQGVPT